jgi:hypothetical protein
MVCCLIPGPASNPPLVRVKLIQRLELAALLAEPAVDAIYLGAHRRQVHSAHFMALIVRLGCAQMRPATVHLAAAFQEAEFVRTGTT